MHHQRDAHGAPDSEELLGQLRTFIRGSTFESKVRREDLIHSALFLLEYLPSARQGVLEYLCTIFDDAVSIHIMRLDHAPNSDESKSKASSELELLIQEVEAVLLKFVNNNPNAWAPVISAWCIELLGQMSSKYAGRRGVPPSSSLNELLQMWMSCLPAKILIGVASQCFASLVGSAPDVSVDALLEASVKHSPHFDWVVAHIGSCFPQTIINRVLMCGLRDFFQCGSAQNDSGMETDDKVPKMASVVGILGHLASRHARDIRLALLHLFQESLSPMRGDMYRCAVPFLLQLASMSPMLLRVIATDLVNTLTPKILNQLADHFAHHTSQEANGLLTLAVFLTTKCDDGAYKVLTFLLNTACGQGSQDDPEQDAELTPVVRQTCAAILNRVLLEVQHVSHSKSTDAATCIPLLQSLARNTTALARQLATATGDRCNWLAKVLTCVAVHCSEISAAQVMTQLLTAGSSPEHLNVFVQIQEEVQMKYPNILDSTLSKVIGVLQSKRVHSDVDREQAFRNMARLVQWEQAENQCTVRSQLSTLLGRYVIQLGGHMYDGCLGERTAALELLDHVPRADNLDAGTCLKLGRDVTSFFLMALHVTDMAEKFHICRTCIRCLHKMSQSGGSVQKAVLRFLLEGTLSEDFSPFFGGKPSDLSPIGAMAQGPGQSGRLDLPVGTQLKDSLQSSVRGRSAIFHSGVIGQGLKALPTVYNVDPEQQIHNRQLLIEALFAICSHGNGADTSEGQPMGDKMATDDALERRTIGAELGREVALMLLELVIPDVMYNGLPWPDEEFMKVTVERDLLVRKRFEDNPVLWDLLDLLTASPGALCFCSVVLRALTATLLAHWESARHRSATDTPRQLQDSCRVIRVMTKGFMLPSPLCYVGETLALLSPYEVYLVLISIWKYMKENPPDPTITSRQTCEPWYTDTIRYIFHSNIHKLGHLYPRFFQHEAANLRNRLMSE